MLGSLKASKVAQKSQNFAETRPAWWGDSLGLYVHVPFCATTCDFCAFYQVQGDRAAIHGYLDGIRREAELVSNSRSVDTCFWGGGTPGLLRAEDLDTLCEIQTRRFGVPQEEWTVEMAPSTVKADKLAVLKERGVTRISMGVQSFDDELLDKLGRQHSRKQIYKAYELIREGGFRSVNLDLIFAIPGQTEETLERDFKEAMALEPDHLSTYCLTFEEDTALFAKLSEGKVQIDRIQEERLYRKAWELAAVHGFAQYEVSNYAKAGHECLHNINTWRMNEWIGFGPSAASQESGIRYSNPPDLKKWQAELDVDSRGNVDRQELSKELLFEDALIFGLRMNSGISIKELEQRFGRELDVGKQAVLERLVSEGKAIIEGEDIRLIDEGRLVADAIGAELME